MQTWKINLIAVALALVEVQFLSNYADKKLRAKLSRINRAERDEGCVADNKEIYDVLSHAEVKKYAHPNPRRLPSQPLHRSILSQRKRTVLSANGIKSSPADVVSFRFDTRILDDALATSLTLAATALDNLQNDTIPSPEATNAQSAEEMIEEATSKESTVNPSSKTQSNWEPPSEQLTSPWWVRITEEYETNSYNFIPESRRAACSVVFTFESGGDRVLEKNGQLSDVAAAGGGTGSGGLSNSTKDSSPPDAAHVEANTSSSNNTHKSSNRTSLTPDTEHNNKETTYNTQPNTDSTTKEEYMIISGGYTDHDWKTFPVYAFPLSTSTRTGSGEWIDLSPLPSELASENDSESWCKSMDNVMARDRLYQEAKYLNVNATTSDPWEHADPCSPSGRMGHSSFIHKNHLYVFGGLIYDAEQAPSGGGNRESFRLEDVPFVYRLDLGEMFEARLVDTERRERRRTGVLEEELGKLSDLLEDATDVDDLESLLKDDDALESLEELETSSEAEHDVPHSKRKVKGWQRIIPRVKPFETLTGQQLPTMAASEVLLKSINRGEAQGGMWQDKFVMYGGLRIALIDSMGPHAASKVMKGPSYETRGSNQMRSRIIELPLGDIWTYDLELDAFEKITNDLGVPIGVDSTVEVVNEEEEQSTPEDGMDDDGWWSDLDATLFPRQRTAHAATVVGDELIVHGGMGFHRKVDDWDGTTEWETLDDLWIFNLKTLRWKRRWMFPLLVRSYHSLVGWSVKESLMGWGNEFENFTSWDGPVVAAFGGYTNGIDIFSGDSVAYVFDDLLVSYPPTVEEGDNFGVSSLWLKANNPDKIKYPQMVSNRFEHAAVLSEETGSMFIWGGKFQDTSNIKGLWMINVAGKESQVSFKLAEDDGIYDEYEATLTALHTIVIMMMFLSMTLTLLLGLTQRYNELLMQQTNGDAALRIEDIANQDFGGDHVPTWNVGTGLHPQGLHPQIISTLPEKIYGSDDNNDAIGEEEAKEEDCCPICLVEYQNGDTLRVLPCNHYMHKTCVDAWLINNPSCPSCRHSLSDLVDDRPLMQLRTLRSRLSTRSIRRFRHFHPTWVQGPREDSSDENNAIEMISDFDEGSVFDLRFISSLELFEEGSDDTDQLDADVEAGNRSRMSRRERSFRLANLRRNVARIRRDRRAARNGSRSVPLAEPDEEAEISIV